MASTSHRLKCCKDPDIFCYVCVNFTLQTQRHNITKFVKRKYFSYFKVPLGDQDKNWPSHKVCKTCVGTLRSWSQGETLFGVPMVWREPTNPLDNYYFCLVNVKGFIKKQTIPAIPKYPSSHSTSCTE